MDQVKKRMLWGVLLAVPIIYISMLLFTLLSIKCMGFARYSAFTLFASRIGVWVSMMLIWFYAWKIEKQQLLIWKDREYQWWVYPVSIIAIFVAIYIGLIAMNIVLKLMKFPLNRTVLNNIGGVMMAHPWLIVFTSLTAGVTEELTFRGYIQPRLEILLRNPVLAIIVSSLLFGVVHLGYKSVYQFIGPIIIGAVFATYYWKFRNIKVLIAAHFIWDVLSISLNIYKHH